MVAMVMATAAELVLFITWIKYTGDMHADKLLIQTHTCTPGTFYLKEEHYDMRERVEKTPEAKVQN